ncbi:MAG: nitroreductase family protein [Clostridium perfringens]|nr:nitroreductase family protein [Clostridium perfringens]
MIDFLKTRRSIRIYEEKEIEQEKIQEILKAGLLAPTSRGGRSWEFIVVNDKEILEVLSKCKPKAAKFIANAGVAIIIIANTEKSSVWEEDCAISSAFMTLETHKLGLGSCIVQIRGRKYNENISASEYLKEKLNIPENYEVESILSIGYKGQERPAYEDKDIDFNKVHYNKF